MSLFLSFLGLMMGLEGAEVYGGSKDGLQSDCNEPLQELPVGRSSSISQEDFKAAKEGDPKALDRVWRGSEGYIRRILSGNIEGSWVVDDLVQEVSIKFLSLIKKYEARNGAAFFTYLYAVVFNVARMHWRSEAREAKRLEKAQQSVELLDRYTYVAPSRSSPDHSVSLVELSDYLDEIRDALTPREKDLWDLIWRADVDVAEAELMSKYSNLTAGSLRVAKWRVLRKVQRRYPKLRQFLQP